MVTPLKSKSASASNSKPKGGAPDTKYSPSKQHIVSRASIKQTWGIVPPQEWLSLLKEISPANDWRMKGQTVIQGKCPYHDDSTPSFTLSFEKGMGKCYGAGCEKLVTDIINLVAKLRNCSYVEALLFVYNRFNLGDVISTRASEYSDYNEVQEVKKAAAIAMSKIVETVIMDCPDYLEYCIPAVRYLIDVRKIPEAVLPLMPVGIFGKPVHMKKFIPITLHAVYDTYFKAQESDTYYGCICFHYNDSPGSISRFKFRHKNQLLLNKLKRFKDYGDLPDVEKALLFSKGNSNYVTDPYTSEIGVFGLHRYQSMVGKNDTNAYVTEGEFDALSVMAVQFLTGNVNFMMFGIGGKGATDVSFLREYGVRTIWLVSDHPIKQGNDWAKSVLSNKANFLGTMGQTPLHFKVFLWPPGMKGGDLDEAVKQQGYEVVEEFLQRNRNAHFLNSIAWIFKSVDENLEALDQKYDRQIEELDTEAAERAVEISNIESTRKGDLQDAILQGFRLVHTTTDKQEYTGKYIMTRGIDITTIEAVNTSVYALDTIQGVVQRVVTHLKEFFNLSYYMQKTGEPVIYGWSRKNEEMVEIPSFDKAIFKTIALYVKQDIEVWFDAMLPDNPIYYDGVAIGDASLSASKKKRANSRHIIEKAFEHLMTTIGNYDSLAIMSQGVHYLDLPTEVRQQGFMYFVNGNKVFRGQFKNEGEMEWVRVHNIVDKGIVFEDTGMNRKWSYVDDISDLYEAQLVDLNKLFDQICLMLNGWTFKDHDVTVQYLAAYLISITTMRATADTSITLFSGLTTSGKTAFASGLLGGINSKHSSCPHILEAVYQMDDTTLPALYQTMEGKSHLVVLDEAETGDKYATRKDENLKEVVRMAHKIPMGGTSIDRGGKDKASRKSYFLRFPMLLSAINIPQSATFLTRTIQIYTVQDMDHLPVEQYIDKHFTTKDIEDIRKGITTGLIPHIPQIMALRSKLSVSLRVGDRAITKVSNRFLDCILTPLTVYEFLGKDSKKLYHDILRANKAELETVHNQDTQNELLDGCLYTGCVKMTSLDNIVDFVSPKNLLVNKDYNILNSSDCGVYFIEEPNWIVIVWRQAKFGVLSRTKFSTLEVSALKGIAQKDPYIKKVVTAADHNTVQHHLNLKDVKHSSAYSILDLEYLLGYSITENGDIATPDVLTELATFQGIDALEFLDSTEDVVEVEKVIEVKVEKEIEKEAEKEAVVPAAAPVKTYQDSCKRRLKSRVRKLPE